jgi:hypothetical protein
MLWRFRPQAPAGYGALVPTKDCQILFWTFDCSSFVPLDCKRCRKLCKTGEIPKLVHFTSDMSPYARFLLPKRVKSYCSDNRHDRITGSLQFGLIWITLKRYSARNHEILLRWLIAGQWRSLNFKVNIVQKFISSTQGNRGFRSGLHLAVDAGLMARQEIHQSSDMPAFQRVNFPGPQIIHEGSDDLT